MKGGKFRMPEQKQPEKHDEKKHDAQKHDEKKPENVPQPGTAPNVASPSGEAEVKGREHPLPKDAPKEVSAPNPNPSTSNPEHGKPVEHFRQPQGARIPETPGPEEICQGMPMHVGAPKHCPKCPDHVAGKTFLTPQKGHQGLVGFANALPNPPPDEEKK